MFSFNYCAFLGWSAGPTGWKCNMGCPGIYTNSTSGFRLWAIYFFNTYWTKQFLDFGILWWPSLLLARNSLYFITILTTWCKLYCGEHLIITVGDILMESGSVPSSTTTAQRQENTLYIRQAINRFSDPATAGGDPTHRKCACRAVFYTYPKLWLQRFLASIEALFSFNKLSIAFSNWSLPLLSLSAK